MDKLKSRNNERVDKTINADNTIRRLVLLEKS